MSAYESRTQFNKVPFRCGSLYDIVGVDAHGIEYFCKFIHECDVDIALRILDNLACLGHAYCRSLVCAVDEHTVVQIVDNVGDLRRRPAGHLAYFLHGVQFVTRIYALGRISGIEVSVIFQSAHTFNHRQTLLLGHSGING